MGWLRRRRRQLVAVLQGVAQHYIRAAPGRKGVTTPGTTYENACPATILCYAALRCAALRCAELRCAVLCCAVLCYAMLCGAVLCHAMLCYAMLCYAVLCLRHALLREEAAHLIA